MSFPDVPRPDIPRSAAAVRDFVNTTDFETGEDDLSAPAQLVDYLTSEGLLATQSRATTADLTAAHRLRAGLRRALEFNHDGIRDPLPALGEALAVLPVRLTWSKGATNLEPAKGGVPGALARIGIAAHQAAADDLWWRLKICSSDECGWAYFDHSKNRSRQWCEYGCGNRIKTRAYRARQKTVAL